jgi:hypothetical protein
MELNTENLPNEILDEIFGYLSLKDLLNFTSVDRRLSELRPIDYINWKCHISKCNSIIKKINYEISNYGLTASRNIPDDPDVNKLNKLNKLLPNCVIYNHIETSPSYNWCRGDVAALTINNWSGKKMSFGWDWDLWEKETWETGSAYHRITYNFIAYIGVKMHVIEDEDHYTINITNY